MWTYSLVPFHVQVENVPNIPRSIDYTNARKLFATDVTDIVGVNIHQGMDKTGRYLHRSHIRFLRRDMARIHTV